MSNEPDVGFSNKAGGLNPPGWYTYPVGFGGSTAEKPVRKYIPYPYAPGGTPEPDNPADIPDK